jgi:hypothetical protein
MFSCTSTEIITLTDVSDVYNISTGHDPHEFIIRRSRQGITLYFSSPERDAIIKVSYYLPKRMSLTGMFFADNPRSERKDEGIQHIHCREVFSIHECSSKLDPYRYAQCRLGRRRTPQCCVRSSLRSLRSSEIPQEPHRGFERFV